MMSPTAAMVISLAGFGSTGSGVAVVTLGGVVAAADLIAVVGVTAADTGLVVCDGFGEMVAVAALF